MKYRLTEDWLGYKKGHVFSKFELVGGESEDLSVSIAGLINLVELSLLLKTGILEEVREDDEFVPRKGDKYWSVDGDGQYMYFKWDGIGWDKRRLQFGNCFRTETEALEASEKIKTLLLSLKK